MGRTVTISRRRLLGGLGVAGLAGASNVTGAGAAPAGAVPSGSRRFEFPSDFPEALPNPITQTLGAIDFQPRDMALNLVTQYVDHGGIRVTQGSAFFHAPLRVPVGATLLSAAVFLNPNGGPRRVTLNRFNPSNGTFDPLAAIDSTSGSVIERVPLNLALPHTVQAGWNYRIDNTHLSAGGADLYGGEVTYRIPPNPIPGSGGFVPFTGSNRRVYDSRSADTKLGDGEERVIGLGVPGTARAAAFNLTITQTEGAGFVSAYGANLPFPGTSSINWTTPNADIANLVVSAVDGSGAIKLRGANGITHVVVDVIGHFA